MGENKTVMRLGAAGSIVCMMWSCVFAGSDFVPVGTRADSMGGAYVAIANDATAIYWNPAGLAQLTKAGVEASAFYTTSHIKSNTSLTNAAVPDSADGDFPLPNLGESLAYHSKTFNVNALLPFIAGYKNLHGVTIAAGFYSSGGGGGKWEDTDRSTGLIGSIDSTLGYMIGNVSAGKQITKNLSLGLGLNLITIMKRCNNISHRRWVVYQYKYEQWMA